MVLSDACFCLFVHVMLLLVVLVLLARNGPFMASQMLTSVKIVEWVAGRVMIWFFFVVGIDYLLLIYQSIISWIISCPDYCLSSLTTF